MAPNVNITNPRIIQGILTVTVVYVHISKSCLAGL